MATVTYSSNNSGGNWWLDDDDWKKLEQAGWVVHWVKDDSVFHKGNDRFLGALAMEATREGLSLEAAIAEWEDIVGQRSTDEGCPCCGYPHNFYD